MALTLISISAATPPLASLSLGSGTRSASLASANRVSAAASSCSIRSSFLSAPSTSLSFQSSSSFAGLSLGLDFGNVGVPIQRRRVLQVRAGKAALCLTKRSRSRKSLARTHGFRRRMRTTTGRAVLKRRRAKGRKVLCTKSNPSSGKRA